MNPRMKKSTKILVVIVAIIASIIAVCHISLDSVAEKELHAALSNTPDAKIDFRNLSFSLIGGIVQLQGVEVEKDSIKAYVEAIKLEGISWKSLMRGEASAKRLLIKGPSAKIVITGEEENSEEETGSVAAPENSFLKKVALEELRIENASLGLTSLKDSTKVYLKELDFTARDLGYLFAENKVEYNDSCYTVELDSLDFMDPTGLSRITLGHLTTADGGPINVLAMHLFNCVGKEQVAERMGKVASMWYDVQLDTVYTNPINIPRMVKSESVDIEHVHMSGPKIVLFQDDRYPPAVPYPTMQEGLNQATIPVHIGKVDAVIKDFTFIWETTHVNRGTFAMKNVRLALNSVSNAQGNLMEMVVKAGHVGHSRLNLTVYTRNDKQETTYGKMVISDLEGSRLDPFLRPLFGATASAQIHNIDCDFKGDKSHLDATFCMLYENLKLKAWDDETAPFKIVAQNSGLITFLANIAVPHANPINASANPKVVEFGFNRNPMQPYPTYLIQNLTTGMLKTCLPGGKVHKKDK